MAIKVREGSAKTEIKVNEKEMTLVRTMEKGTEKTKADATIKAVAETRETRVRRMGKDDANDYGKDSTGSSKLDDFKKHPNPAQMKQWCKFHFTYQGCPHADCTRGRPSINGKTQTSLSPVQWEDWLSEAGLQNVARVGRARCGAMCLQ